MQDRSSLMNPNNPECHSPTRSANQPTQEESDSAGGDEATIMAAVDGTGEDEQFVIADTSCDDAWLAMSADESPELEMWI